MNICNTETLTEYIAAVFFTFDFKSRWSTRFSWMCFVPRHICENHLSIYKDRSWLHTKSVLKRSKNIYKIFFNAFCYVYWNNDFTTSSRNREPFCCFILWKRSPSLQNSITMYRWPSSAVWVRPDRENESEISHHVWV